MPFSEMQVRKRLVQTWINMVPPLTIVLKRPVFSTTDAGGTTISSTTTLASQEFGFMPFKRRLTIELGHEPYNLGSNETSDIYYVLIAVPGTVDILKGDYFDWSGNVGLQQGRYDVAFVQARNHDHLQAGIRYRGP